MLGNALAPPSDAGTHHLIQMTHALVQRMEHNIGQKLDMIQAQQKTLTETVDQHTAQLASNSEDIASINARVQTLENDPKTSPHIEKLEIEMNNLAHQMQEFSRQRVSSAPPSSRAPLPPRDSSRASTLSPTRPRATVPAAHAASVDLEVDWNRLIIGGWHLDTRREKIESEAKQLLQAFGIQESVNELIVYGRRASACHVLLHPMPEPDAKRRVLTWHAQHKDKHLIPSSNTAAWMTPHKSAHKRLKNRATKYAASLLQSILHQTNPDQLDIDWNKQIIWYRDMRVVAFHKSDLLPGPDPANHEVTYTDPRNHDELSFLLGLRKLAKVTGEEIPALQQALRTLQSE